MGELRITPEQGTSQIRKPQAKPQTTKTGNIVIEFSSLPNNMKTAKVRAFYDKDGSGFLESKNANGKNEIALMQKAFGVNLSKYKSDIIHTKNFHDKNIQTYEGYDKSGNKLAEIQILGGTIQECRFKKGHNNIETIDGNNKSGKCNKLIHYDINYNPTSSSEVDNNNIVRKFYYKDGYEIFSNNGTKNGFYKTNGTKVYDNIPIIKNSKNLTKGKNNLQQISIYEVTPKTSDLKLTLEQAVKQGEKKKLKNYMTLNGKPVKAKPIGKGRYEVTTEKGNVYYISHDGVNLKPEYVRQK